MKLELPNQERVDELRQQAFLAHCQKSGMEPSEQNLKLFNAGANWAVEYTKDIMMPYLTVMEQQQRMGGRTCQREGRNVSNLWGLLR